MGRRSRTITVETEVEIDPQDVLESLSTEDLIEELSSREDKPKTGSSHGFTIGRLNDWDTESLLEAVRLDDGRRAVDLLREAFH